MRNIQKPGKVAAAASSSSQEIAYAESRHTVAHDQVRGTPARQRQRQPRTCFSSIQRHALERAFNESNYFTTESCLGLQELGIPKKAIMVWFKNRRVKSKKQSPPAAKFRPSILANQSTVLQPWYYSLNEVQRENWASSSADGFVSESIRIGGMSRPLYSGSSWLCGQSSRMYAYHDSSAAGSFGTVALSDCSSGRHISNYSNVPWIDSAPNVTASLPLDRQVDQRVPEGNIGPGPQQWVQSMGPLPSVPMMVSQIAAKTYSAVPWIDSALVARSTLSLTFDNEGERRAPDDPGAEQWDQRNGLRTMAPWNQITETSHSMALMGPKQAPKHELEYTSLLDDVLAVVKLDLATQNNRADPSFLDNVRSNMQ